MSDVTADMQVREELLMQAWMRADKSAMRPFLRGDFTMIVGTKPPQLLDRPSFLEACQTRFRCYGFRFGEAYGRQHKKLAWFAAGVELEMQLAGREWKGAFWLADLWRKSAFGGWKLCERSLSRAEDDEGFSHAVERLQLWK
ncbi:MAG: hypothetical protein AAF707_08605 [Pseudomonadota bacterium]